MLLTTIGGVSPEQKRQIDEVVEMNRALEEQVRGWRLRLTHDQCRYVAAKG
ncbi:MAG: hypothetical protein AAF726_10815 [Planctomycetota bacterium]